MITHKCIIRTRYNEVDQMGYVYHANYVNYCHQARTELMRELGIHDKALEDMGIILPVIEMNLKYLKPAFYDDELCVVCTINKIPDIRINIDFAIFNQANEKICKARSTIVVVDEQSRKPIRVPKFIKEAFTKEFIKLSA